MIMTTATSGGYCRAHGDACLGIAPDYKVRLALILLDLHEI
jgi:hypothetical protein